MGILTGNTVVDIVILIIVGIIIIMVLGWFLGWVGHPYFGPRMLDGVLTKSFLMSDIVK